MSETATEPVEQTEPQAPPIERWEDESIDKLRIPEKLYLKLHQHGLATLGLVWEQVVIGEQHEVQARDRITIASAIDDIRNQWQPWRTRPVVEFKDVPTADVEQMELMEITTWGSLDDELKEPSVSECFTQAGKATMWAQISEADRVHRQIRQAAAMTPAATPEAAPVPAHEPVAEAAPVPAPEPQPALSPIKPTATHSKWDSPEALAAYDAETVLLVNDKNSTVSELEAQWEELHGEASVAKKEFEKAAEELRVLIRDRQANRGKPRQLGLFDGVNTSEPTQTANRVDAGNATDVVTEAKPVDPRADLWMKYPITIERWKRFGLTAKDVEKLNSGETKNHGTHPIVVLGDVSNFITPNPANPSYARTLKDVKGFGDAAYDRWCEAETQFWAWYGRGGDSEFAIEMGVTGETAKGTPEPDRIPSEPDASSEPTPAPEPEPAGQPEPDQADADGAATDAERKPNGKPKRKRKKATA